MSPSAFNTRRAELAVEIAAAARDAGHSCTEDQAGIAAGGYLENPESPSLYYDGYSIGVGLDFMSARLALKVWMAARAEARAA